MSWELPELGDELDLGDYRHCCHCDDVEHQLAEDNHPQWYCGDCAGF